MLDALKRALFRFRAEGHEGISTPTVEEAAFLLNYGDLAIGTLRLNGGTWEFRYSDQFKSQSDVRPLVDFPDINKVYQSPDLWPFFMARIPSTSQPDVIDAIRAEGLDAHSDVQLLKRFGQRTISNPFVLKSA